MNTLNLTTKVLDETLRQLNNTNKELLIKDFLVVVTGGEVGRKDTINFIKDCLAEGKSVTLVLSQSAEGLYSVEKWSQSTGLNRIITNSSPVNIFDLISNHFNVVVPTLTTNSAAKIATGIADNITTNIIFHSLLKGKAVVACKESCHPDYLPYLVKEGNPGYQAIYNKLHENVSMLKGMGVSFIALNELSNLLATEVSTSQKQKKTEQKETKTIPEKAVNLGGKVITQEDLAKVADNQKIYVERNCIITPLAQDMADSKNITWVFK